jgi:putrescine transport system permease protein
MTAAAGRWLRWAALLLGFGFLYLPLVWVVVYSFNDARLTSVWGGASLRWYGELWRNQRLIDAAALSLAIAAMSASMATVLGGLTGFALARLGRFRGRWAISAAIGSLLVVPEVVIGLALLLLFVTMDRFLGWPSSRGVTTVAIAHATLAMAYVAIVVRARLDGFDRRLEEAALDLGATPATVFWRITLPLTLPALGVGWLLAFVISLDDVVIASFVAGPGATTLPMVVFSSVRLGLSPQINALATILLVVVAAATAAAAWLLRRIDNGSARPQGDRR